MGRALFTLFTVPTAVAHQRSRMKPHLFLPLILVAALLITACSPILDIVQNTMPQASTVEAGEVATATEKVDSMKIRLIVEDKVITATLIDSNTTRDFVSLLPLTLTLEDYAGIEKISYLPRELSTQDAPAVSEFTTGDIAYYAPWGNLAIHHHEFGYANGLVILGKIDGGKEALIVPGSVTVTTELVSEP